MGNPASIPLSGIAPPVQNPLDVYMRVQALRGMQLQQQGLSQENQLRQIQLQDQQGMRQAYIDAQGDPEKFLTNVKDSRYGISYNGLISATNNIVEMRQKMLGLTDAEMAQHQKVADLYNGFIKQVKDAPPQQRAQVWAQGAQGLQGLPGLQIPAQYPGDDNLDMLQYHGITLSKSLDYAKTQAEASKNTNEANLAAAKTPGAKAESTIQQQQAAMTPGERALQPNLYYQAAQGTPGAQSALNLETRQKVGVARAEGQARLDLQRQAMGGQGALANVAPHLVPAATAAATKAGEDYAQAQSVTQRLNDMMDAARKGNVVSYQILPQEGALQITTSQGVHRINKTEIDQYAGGGSLWQRMEGHFGKTLTGASIPTSVLDDMAQIQAIQARGARSKYENSLKVVNQNYGSTFQPVDMGGQDVRSTPGGSSQPQGRGLSGKAAKYGIAVLGGQ